MSDPPEVECSIAVLGYRAGEQIVPFVERLHQSLQLLAANWEIVVVANYWPGSEDTTPMVAAELSRRLSNVRSVALAKEGAMGWDMRCGLDACRGRLIGVIDGDGQFPPEVILSCFAKLENDDLDLVKTYRISRGDGLFRRALSAAYNATFQVLFPQMRSHRDANSKPKIMTREAYERMDLRADDWFIDAEIMLAAADLELRVGELPVEFSSLDHRDSFVRPQAIFAFVRSLAVERWRRWRT